MANGVLKNIGNYKSISGHWHLTGEVVDHPKFHRGDKIITSRVEDYALDEDGYAIFTENSLYLIENIDRDNFDYQMFTEIGEV